MHSEDTQMLGQRFKMLCNVYHRWTTHLPSDCQVEGREALRQPTILGPHQFARVWERSSTSRESRFL